MGLSLDVTERKAMEMRLEEQLGEIEGLRQRMEVERMHVEAVLEKTGRRLAGPGGAAEVLGLKRTTLQSKMRKLGITRSIKSMPK